MIKYRTTNGIEYASVAKSVREDGKIKTVYERNLGRVIDKTRMIFQNKECGVIAYDEANDEIQVLDRAQRLEALGIRPKAVLDFGDVFFLDNYMSKRGLTNCLSVFAEKDDEHPDVKTLSKKEMHSMLALLNYYMIAQQANCHAKEWLESNYACIRYPLADLDGRRISELLEKIGTYENMNRFFKRYIEWLTEEIRRQKGSEENIENIVIDSIGIPNKIHIELTAISNHNGDVSEEVRLIFAVQKNTRMPIFIRYVPGNIIDATTLTRTLVHLNKLGVDVKYSIFDAGYSTNANMEEMFLCQRDFITRLDSSNLIYKRMKKNVLPDIAKKKNFVHYGNRYAYVDRIETEIVKGHMGYAYPILDIERKNREDSIVFKNAAKKKMTDDDVLKENSEHGFFVLASSIKMDVDQVLPNYYDRQGIEQFLDTACSSTPLDTLRVHKEETFCGHVILSFIGAAVMQMLQNDIKNNQENKKKTGKVADPNTVSIMNTLRAQKIIVYPDGDAITCEPKKIANDAYRMVGIKVPVIIDTKSEEIDWTQ